MVRRTSLDRFGIVLLATLSNVSAACSDDTSVLGWGAPSNTVPIGAAQKTDASLDDAATTDGRIDATATADASSAADARAARDATNDATSEESDGMSHAGDATSDAGAPHVVFVTSAGFTGNLVGEANALVADGGVPAPAPDGGSFGASDWRAAADALCQWSALRGGLPGTFLALLAGPVVDGGPGDLWARVSDADGPWSLVDGTPVADTVAALSNGALRASINQTEMGTPRPFSPSTLPFPPTPALAWSGDSVDCNGWTVTESDGGGPVRGGTGGYRWILQNYYTLGFDSRVSCTEALPLYCVQVGPGAGPNRARSVPPGGKIAFVTATAYRTDFAARFVADGGAAGDVGFGAGGLLADGGTDAVHTAADAFCNAEAAGKIAGSFRAWVSSSNGDAKSYFTARGMNGPWYRPDGMPVAASLANLTDTNGISSQIALGPDGAFSVPVQQIALTGSLADGTLAVGDNCKDFTDGASSSSKRTRAGYTASKDGLWAWADTIGCAGLGAFYCFEE